jgi:3-ketosteroid 9alpha-monooxygenase subunit A
MFPKSWYQVAYSHEIKKDSIRTLRYFGKELVMFRDANGEVHAFDAHCPHLGAHLGQGCVVENTIRCPFHHWRFDAQGQCVAIPYAQKIPPKATLRRYHTHELAGMVFVHSHQRDEPPPFVTGGELQTRADNWVRSRSFERQVRMRCQDLPENTVDPAHLTVLHGYSSMPAFEYEVSDACFSIGYTSVYQKMFMQLPSKVRFNIYEPGAIVFKMKYLKSEIMLITTVSPVNAENCDVRLNLFLKNDLNPLLLKVMERVAFAEFKKQAEQDIAIIERKVYQEHPVLCDGDGPLGKFRRWYSQFAAEQT